MNESRVGLKENRAGLYAGFAGGFGFYIAWMILAMEWQTATVEEANVKTAIGIVLGLVVGGLLYLGVYSLVNKKLAGPKSKNVTRDTILGILAGLVIAFLFGLLFYNPTGVGFTPLFPLDKPARPPRETRSTMYPDFHVGRCGNLWHRRIAQRRSIVITYIRSSPKERKMNANSSSRFTLLKAIFLPLVAAVLLLSACDTCPKPEQQLPDGTYTTTVAVEDLTNIGMPPDSVCENAGTFNLTVTGHKWGLFQAAAPGCIVENPSWSGTWIFCGDEVRFTLGGSSYTYQWAFNGAELRFTRVDDIVPHRIVWMTTYPWILQK